MTVVNQCGCYIRENIPISFNLWKKTKSTDNDADIVPETEKEMLWADIIEIDKCRVLVYDSLRKPTYYYQDLINIIQKAWARFLEKHIEISSPPAPLEFTTNWPVRIHIAHLLSFL